MSKVEEYDVELLDISVNVLIFPSFDRRRDIYGFCHSRIDGEADRIINLDRIEKPRDCLSL